MHLNNSKMLVCDDSILFRKTVKDYLASNGCSSILEAEDGEKAVAAYKEHHPDIVFLDIIMPQKSGIDAVREIVEYDPNACVIMFSSVGTQKYIKDAIFAGARDFLQKPFEKDAFAAILKRYCKPEGEI